MARRRNLESPDQLTLWQSVADVYLRAGDREIDNATMYAEARSRAGVSEQEFDAKVPIGKDGAEHSPMARTARWVQQTLKMRGVIERVPDKRGVWRLTREAKTELREVKRGFVILGFSTRLGVALWADCRDALDALDEPLSLVITSPPYALQRARAYGNPKASEYVDFICSALEPVIPKLARGASLILNVTNKRVSLVAGKDPRTWFRDEWLFSQRNQRAELGLLRSALQRVRVGVGPAEFERLAHQSYGSQGSNERPDEATG